MSEHVQSVEPVAPSPKLGGVYYSPVGSRDQDRDVANLEDRFGMQFEIAERPGTSMTRFDRGLADRLTNHYAELIAEPTAEALARLAKSGVEQVVCVGHSAGASAALVAVDARAVIDAHDASLPQFVAVYATDPVAWQPRSPEQARRDYQRYSRNQRQMLAEDASLIQPSIHDLPGTKAAARATSSGTQTIMDGLLNRGFWSSDYAELAAQNIALEQPQVAIGLDFASYSMSASPEYYTTSRAKILKLREGHDAAAPVFMNIIPNTVHASFDNRDAFHDLFGKFMVASGIIATGN